MSKTTIKMRFDSSGAVREIATTQAAVRQIRRTIILENKRRRAVRLRMIDLLSPRANDWRKMKRADRLEQEVLQTWARMGGPLTGGRMQAFADIADASAQALNALKMIRAGMTLNFRPKVIVE